MACTVDDRGVRSAVMRHGEKGGGKCDADHVMSGQWLAGGSAIGLRFERNLRRPVCLCDY
jgi:hypothetical protein